MRSSTYRITLEFRLARAASCACERGVAVLGSDYVSFAVLYTHHGHWIDGGLEVDDWGRPRAPFACATWLKFDASSYYLETTMKVDKLKVRPKKRAAQAPCAAEFAAVLACWASSSDIRSQSVCAEPTKALRDCMAVPVRLIRMFLGLTQRAGNKRSKPTINYHLARFSKRV